MNTFAISDLPDLKHIYKASITEEIPKIKYFETKENKNPNLDVFIEVWNIIYAKFCS
jgi:hypothetical protein